MTRSADPWRPVAWCPEAREAALGYFGTSIADIEKILRVDSPDAQVREDLAWSLYSYARDTGRDHNVGSGEGSPAQIRHSVETITKAAQSLQTALAPTDAAASSTVAVMLMAGDVDVAFLHKQIDAILAVLEKVEIGKGGGRPLDDPEHWLLMERTADLFELTAQREAALTEDRRSDEGIEFGGDFFRMAELVEAAAAAATNRQPIPNSVLGIRLRRLRRLRLLLNHQNST
jgi:hypothetical protein